MKEKYIQKSVSTSDILMNPPTISKIKIVCWFVEAME